MHECEKCGAYVNTILFCNDGMMCDQCSIEINPPKMRIVVIEKVANRPLYNITLKSYESRMTVKDFEGCGWFLRRKKQRNGFTFYDLEFHGTVKCDRFPEVRFPPIYPKCTNSRTCTYSMTQRAYPEGPLG